MGGGRSGEGAPMMRRLAGFALEALIAAVCWAVLLWMAVDAICRSAP